MVGAGIIVLIGYPGLAPASFMSSTLVAPRSSILTSSSSGIEMGRALLVPVPRFGMSSRLALPFSTVSTKGTSGSLTNALCSRCLNRGLAAARCFSPYTKPSQSRLGYDRHVLNSVYSLFLTHEVADTPFIT